YFLFFLFLFHQNLCYQLCTCFTQGEITKFLLILADDLGIGEVGCYGNDTIRTPNTDGLAKVGVRLSQHIAVAVVCTPSRAAFLTGRYRIRSGMASSTEWRVLFWNRCSGGLSTNKTAFARILHQQGYSTALVGKWHMGCQGTDDPELMIILAVLTLLIGKLTDLFSVKWKIIICLAICGLLYFISWFSSYGFTKYWKCILMRNHDITEQPMNLEKNTFDMLKEAVSLIERNEHRPFLLLVSLLHIHIPFIITEKFQGRSQHGLSGELLDVIDTEGLKNPTFVYFASDHGGSLEANRGNLQAEILKQSGDSIFSVRVINRHTLRLCCGTVQRSRHEFMFHYCGVFLHAVQWHQKDSITSPSCRSEMTSQWSRKCLLIFPFRRYLNEP
uniref:Sulfatase N-terminal domain-containing protein n=1 Tax=Strigops habroptila TaxID=2489341 RepID=A0A672UA58_STRHB